MKRDRGWRGGKGKGKQQPGFVAATVDAAAVLAAAAVSVAFGRHRLHLIIKI